MSQKHFLALPVTGETFAEVREKNRYYVDKTPYLKQVFSEDESVDENSLIDGTTVLLLTRPRRFGKTLLMNMFFQGSIQAMPPALQMDKMPLKVIRPLCLIDESDLQEFAAQNNYPEQVKICPFEKESNRPDVRALLEELEARFPGVKDSLWASMQHIYPQYLP